MSIIFQCISRFSCSSEKLFQFHAGPQGFDSLVSLDSSVQVVQKPKSILKGERAILRLQIAPKISILWESLHTDYKEGEMFEDTQVQGPFSKFIHKHIFHSEGEKSLLEDRIELDFPILAISKYFILLKLKPQFQERHKITAEKIGVEYNLLNCGFLG
jgi:ligand-binding SRPBCC domain-containing protein